MEKMFLHRMSLEGSACPSPVCTQLFPVLCSAVRGREGEHAKLPPQTGFHLDLSKERGSLETGRCEKGEASVPSLLLSPPAATLLSERRGGSPNAEDSQAVAFSFF